MALFAEVCQGVSFAKYSITCMWMKRVLNRCYLQSWSANVDGTDTCHYALQQVWISCGPGESSDIETVSFEWIICWYCIFL